MAHGPDLATLTYLPTMTALRSSGREYVAHGAENICDPDLHSSPVAAMKTCRRLGALRQHQCICLTATEVSRDPWLAGRYSSRRPLGRMGFSAFRLPEAPALLGSRPPSGFRPAVAGGLPHTALRHCFSCLLFPVEGPLWSHGAHPGNPGQAPRLKRLNLITAAKSLLQ